MSWASNALAQVLIDPEASYKVAPSASTAVKIAFNTIDLRKTQEPQEPGTLGSGQPNDPFYSNASYAGTLVVPLDEDSFPYVCRMVFGAPTTTGSIAPYTHKFKHLTTRPSYILDIGWTDSGEYHKYTGVQANGMNVSLRDGQLTASIPLIAASFTRGAAAYDGSPTDKSKITNRFGITDISSITEGGGSVTDIEEITFDYMNNIEQGYGLAGAGDPTISVLGLPSIKGSVTGFFQDDTELAKGISKVESSLAAVITKSTHSLSFFVDELKYGHSSPPISGPNGARWTMNYQGFYANGAEASAFRITIVNGIASYA